MNKLILYKDIKKLREKTGANLVVCKEALLKYKNDFNKAYDYITIYGKGNKINIFKTDFNEGVILEKIINLNENLYLGCLIQLSCQTDFVSKNTYFNIAAVRILNFIIKHKIFNIEIINNKLKSFLTILSNNFGENIKITKIYYLIDKYIISYNHNKRIGVITSFINSENKLFNKQITMHVAAKNPIYLSYLNIPSLILKKIYIAALNYVKNKKFNNKIINKIIFQKYYEFLKEKCILQQEFIFNKNIKLFSFLKENNNVIKKYIRIEL